nr:MAG TPA: hypothetical protein [Caudoviricetes sp.]
MSGEQFAPDGALPCEEKFCIFGEREVTGVSEKVTRFAREDNGQMLFRLSFKTIVCSLHS